MKTLQKQTFLPLTIQEAWDFFSTHKNLDLMTPDDMNFKITSEIPEKMYKGLFITYKISPILNIPLDWVTEITHIDEPYFFIDEQRKGPYNIWHHEHHFRETDGGVIMTDILYYDIGKSILGWVAGKILVDNKVKGIFEFREKKLKQLFPQK